jgi:ankyrin repeat protein
MQVIVSQSKSRHELERDFFTAVRRGKKNKVKELLEMVNVNSEKDGITALTMVTEEGQTDIVELLLEKGANVNSKNKYGRTALSWASKEGRTEIVELLKKV